MNPGAKKLGRARRAIVAAAEATGLAVVFGLATVGSLLLHLGLPAPHRFATARVNGILAGSFKGTIVIQHVGALHFTRIEDIDAEVLDPEGRRVLRVQGARLRIGAVSLLRSLVRGNRLVVRLPEVTVDGLEAVLEEDPAGDLGLLRAFESREPSTGGRGTEITIPEIHLHHAWVHGHLAAVPVIDADMDDLAGAFTSTPETTEIAIAHLFVRGRGLGGMNPEGTVEARAALPAGAADLRRVSAHFEGRVGEVPVRADGSLVGNEVVGVVDVPETAPTAIMALAPGRIELGAPVSAHAVVNGELPVLRPELRARIGGGEITASGTVTLPDESRADLLATATLSVKDLDVSVLSAGAPRSKLTAAIDADVISHPGGKLAGTFHLESRIGDVSGQVVPAVSAHGELTERSIRGSAQVAERGAATTLRFSLQPRPGGASPSQLAVEIDTTVPDLDGIARVGPIGRGRAHLVGEGTLDLDTRQVSANASVALAGIDVSGVRLARGVVTGSAQGTLGSPHLIAKVLGAGMRVGGYAFATVGATASGTLEELAVETRLVGDDRAPSVSASAHVTRRQDIVVRGARISVERRGVTTMTRIASVRVAGGAVDIHELVLEGLGQPIEATARIEAAGVSVKAKARDVDLSRVATLLAREEDARGHLSFDVTAGVRDQGVTGHVDAQIRDLSARGADGVAVRVSTSMEGTHLHGEVLASLGAVGKVELQARDVALGGPALRLASWRAATGEVGITGALDLQRLLAQLPPESRPVGAAAGAIAIHGKASRASLSASPLLELEASTQGLAVAGKQETRAGVDGAVVLGPVPWSTTGLDGAITLKLDGSTGGTQLAARLHDEHGALASVDASVRVPLAELSRAPEDARTLLRDTPIEAKIEVPRRSLAAMPRTLGKMPLEGEVELAVELHGTARTPKLTLTAKGTNLLPSNATPCMKPLDLDTRLAYDGAAAGVRLAASSDGHEILRATATVKVDAAQAMAGGAIAWEGAGDVALTAFPLDAVSALLGRPVGGNVSGRLAVEDLHRAASLVADIELREVVLDHAAVPRGKVHVGAKNGALEASVRLDQADGFAEATLAGGLAWGAALVPRLDAAKAIDVTVRAKNFRADAAMPFVKSIFSELDGRVDTDAKLHVDPGFKDGQMSGAVAIRAGVFEVPQLGERFDTVEAQITMKPWGTLRVEHLTARGPTGSLAATAEAVLAGLSLRTATAKITIARGQSIPFALEGVPMGRAYGDITASAKMSADGKRADVDVDIPVLHVDLPQSTGNAVQPLELDKTVRVGVHAGPSFIALPMVAPEGPRTASDLLVHAVVTLGADVEVKRDTTVDVVAHGQTVIDVSDKAHVTGRIVLDRGKLELEGKRFTVEHGVVSFVGGDPANPMITATASWDAPDGTHVYADFSGYVASGKLVLRSEPSLTQDQILSLILFGSADGSFGAAAPPGQQESTGVEAAGMVGGTVTQGLNKAISGVTTVDITTRVDTSEADNPRPELAVQITRSVSARLGYKLGVPAPGENPDRTELTLDWRFIRNWSLVAVVGDAGSTALDLMWRLRY